MSVDLTEHESETAQVPPAPAPAPDLEFSGRDTNRALGFRRWNASAHASYYTPTWICEAIAKGLDDALLCPDIDTDGYVPASWQQMRSYSSEGDKKLHVLDPTCGSGRFLVPLAARGHHVMGIELDAASVEVAKKNLGSKSVRAGDLLLYAGLLTARTYEEGGYHLVVTNPPYGLWWDVPNPQTFSVSRDEAVKLESQAVTLEVSVKALAHKGLLVAVVPSSTFETEKDAPLREFLLREVNVLGRVSLGKAFEAEYGIGVEVDLLIGQREGYVYRSFGPPPFAVTDVVDVGAPSAAFDLAYAVSRAAAKWAPPTTKPTKLPQGNLFVSCPIGNDIQVTARGPAGSTTARALLAFLDETMETYNPVQGVLTGVAEAHLSAPALLLRGYEDGLAELRRMGFEASIDEATKRRLDSQRRSFARRVVPLYRPRPHQLLGHFTAKAHEAAHDVSALLYYGFDRDRGERKLEPWSAAVHGTPEMLGRHAVPDKPTLLWKAGSSYRVEPTWIRKKERADEFEEEKKGKPVTVTVDIDRGYLLLRVETEAGWLDVPEMDEERVELFLKAFPLPAVEDVDDLYPDEIERNRETLRRQSPHLFPYQLEDTARLVSKPRGFLAFDVGGGKTACSVAWAKARGYRRALVICESRLIDNWLAESRKFGFEAYRLDTHSAVSELRQRIAAGEKPTGFYVTSYEFLALDGSRTYAPWDCEKFDKAGVRTHFEEANTGETCRDCDARVNYDACPKCEADSSEGWAGAVCGACGFVAFTYDGVRRQSAAYRRMAKLFPCVISDESQCAKSRNSRRGQALRAMRSKGRLVLTATLFKGYITDTYWVLSWILGWDNPLFPYSYRGGAKRFLDCYATYKFVTRRFEETLHVGKAQLLPEVSSLNLFARMMAPFMVRRIDGEMAVLPARHRHVEIIPMAPEQDRFYSAYAEWATEKISRELAQHRDEDVNMGVISQCLWTLRFAATVPSASDNIHREDSPKMKHSGSWAKIERALAIVEEARAKGEKVVLTAPLRPMVAALGEALTARGIPFVSILGSTPVESRHGIVARFNVDDTPVLLAAMGAITRGLNITGACRIVVCATEWSPESLTQVCGRLHRPGQMREVHEHVLLSLGTIDTAMYDLCTAKESALREAMDGRVRYQKTAALLAAVESNAQMAVARALVRGGR